MLKEPLRMGAAESLNLKIRLIIDLQIRRDVVLREYGRQICRAKRLQDTLAPKPTFKLDEHAAAPRHQTSHPTCCAASNVF
ncbi:hypothetical protein ERN12_14510 [Rhodobacteraceae bacterium]|nr:hypothetical protein ERN12_14510 [Paracoccaceae bacterium]